MILGHNEAAKTRFLCGRLGVLVVMEIPLPPPWTGSRVSGLVTGVCDVFWVSGVVSTMGFVFTGAWLHCWELIHDGLAAFVLACCSLWMGGQAVVCVVVLLVLFLQKFPCLK